MDRALSCLGLPGCFRHAYFEYHARVRLRFKLASGLGEPWTRDGEIPQGCPSSMMFIVALLLPWCRYLAAQEGAQPPLYTDNLKGVSGDPNLLLRAARFTTGYVQLVGQEPAPSTCVILSTSRVVRKDMRYWVLCQEAGNRLASLVCSSCNSFLTKFARQPITMFLNVTHHEVLDCIAAAGFQNLYLGDACGTD